MTNRRLNQLPPGSAPRRPHGPKPRDLFPHAPCPPARAFHAPFPRAPLSSQLFSNSLLGRPALVHLLCVLVLCFWTLLGIGQASGYALRTVVPGDSLGGIADRYNVSVEALVEANGLKDSTIHPGDVLVVPYAGATGGVAELAPEPPPGFKVHTLGPGETLTEIIARHDITLRALVGANPDLSSLDRLPTGVELLIPPSEGLVIAYDGRSLTELMAAYDVDPVVVARANDIRSPWDLAPGMLLFLPGVPPDAALQRLARVRELENIYVWPVHGRISSYFGRRNLGMGTSNFHRGLDVAAPQGTPIVAARAGTVSFAGWSNRGYGYLVKIRHMGNEETWYAHQSQIYVGVGEWVEQGDTIGRVGSTGLSTGPHLHFELHKRGTALDPLGELR